MEIFLGRDAFPGPVVDAAGVVHRFMGEARFAGCIAFANWPRVEIERMLPPELALAANRSPTPELHPVLFMFGAIRNTTILFGGVAMPTGVDYPELLMAIPFVRHRSGCNLHLYMARMFSSVPASVFVGNAYYGFAKSLAAMSWQGPIFTVSDATDGHLLLHASVDSGGGPDGAAPNLAAMRSILALPIVGRRTDGTLVSSYFELDFDAGSVTPADSWISIDAPIMAEVGPHRCYDAPAGTILFNDVIWRLSWPLPCRF
jgi:hypothetical protein